MERVFLVVLVSYLLGAIPVAYLIARLSSVNIFEVGSGNMGTTNVIRAVGPRMGILVLLLDALKSVTAIVLAQRTMPQDIHLATVISASLAILGHNWSVFAYAVTGKLRGGKGAAPAFGTTLMIAPIWLVVLSVLTGVLVLIRTRYMSLGVLVIVSILSPGILICSIFSLTGLTPVYTIYVAVVTGMILYRFRENMRRLAAGTERRVGERA